MQEKQIIDGLKAQKQEALEHFSLRYKPLVFYILRPILNDERDIEECFSDITVTVWNNIQYYNSEKGTFTTWLTAISRNAAFNKARKQSRINLNEEPVYESTPSPCISPEESAIKKERQKLLQKAIATLPKDSQSLFYRKYYYMQSTAQIASELGLSERAVEGRLYRIKKILRKELGGDKDE